MLLADSFFLKVVRKLQGDSSLDKFRVEFEKLLQALRKSHDGEKRLMNKCRELNAELLANAAKVIRVAGYVRLLQRKHLRFD